MAVRIGIDVGGTFTDLVLVDEAGTCFEHKVLTTPGRPTEGILRGLDGLLRRAGRDRSVLAGADVVHGTTLVTNALIERKGPATALLTTDGIRDVLETGRENRYDPYDRLLRRPEPLVPRYRRIPIEERVLADGTVYRALDEEQVRQILQRLASEGVQSVAVCFLHSYLRPDHEQRVQAIAQELGLNLYISLSSEISPQLGEWERLSTTTANAYIQPIVEGYLGELREALAAAGHRGRFYLMWSDGYLASPEATRRQPIHLLESGPAAGALAARYLASRAGHGRTVAFDMGGTTAKICVIDDGEPARTDVFEVGRVHRHKPGSGLPVRVPAIHLLEIGAGGGSIARANDLGLLTVGPTSAGADPGPACYGLGGTEPTVTDANLLLGYLDADRPLAGGLRLDTAAARRAVERLAEPLGLDVEAAAQGIRRVVTENMAQALKLHVTERRQDPRAYTMVAFGGAAPLHAYDIARRVGIRRVLVPAQAGVLSAFGFLTASVGVELAQTCILTLDAPDLTPLQSVRQGLRQRALETLASAGVAPDDATFTLSLDMRYGGQAYEIPVPVREEDLLHADRLAEKFLAAYEARYGLRHEGSVEVRTMRLRAEGPRPQVDRVRPVTAAAPGDRPVTRRVWFEEVDGWVDAQVVPWTDLRPGDRVAGPALVEGEHTTLVVGPAAHLQVTDDGSLVMELEDGRPAADLAGDRLDPVTLEIVLARLRAIADEADLTLMQTAFSSAVRDSKDYSLVITDTQGRSLAFPTECMPLFVTTLPRSIGLLLERFPLEALAPGDVLMTNDPWIGAGHKSDVLLVAPIFRDDRPVAFVGTILHVSDIGGTLGDFRAWDIFEEGLALPPVKLYDRGDPNEQLLALIRANVRLPEELLGDLAAMRAAIFVAEKRLQELLEQAPGLHLDRIADEVHARSERAFRELIGTIPKGVYHAAFRADGVLSGSEEQRRPIDLRVTIEVNDDSMVVDFAGSEAQRPRQAINVPISYTRADTIYALQFMLAPTIPNVGPQFSPIRLSAPERSILNAQPPVPVFARTRTGIHIATVINQALAEVLPGVVQAGCGHNVIFRVVGEDREGSYFGVTFMPKGGMGATGGRDGLDVTVFPTNCTLISTELAETLAPVLIHREMAVDSGGPGRDRGGVGQWMTVWSLSERPLTVSFRPNFMENPPPGLLGGRPGAPARVEIQGRPWQEDPVILQRGECFRVRTAGGGGIGSPLERDPERVRRDVRDGLVSRERARLDYGVVIDEAGRIDEAGTRVLRRAQSLEPAAASWRTHDT